MTNRPQALAVLVAVFLLGGVLGSAGSYYWLKKNPTVDSKTNENDRRPPRERQNFRGLLNLTPDQEKRIGQIMSDRRKQYEALQREQAPKIEALRREQAPKIEAFWAETNRQISEILNPEQRKNFEAFLAEMQKRMRSPRGRNFEPPPSPEEPRDRSSLPTGEPRDHHANSQQEGSQPDHPPHGQDYPPQQ